MFLVYDFKHLKNGKELNSVGPQTSCLPLPKYFDPKSQKDCNLELLNAYH